MIAERFIEICRYDPDKDVLPYMQRFEVDIDQNGRMVPEVLVRLKSVDESISLRRSCREGTRGSRAININGATRPACQTSMKELPSRIFLRVLPGLPVIRDLIVDMMSLFQRYPSTYWVIVDTRDMATSAPLDNLEDPYRVFRRRTILNCTDICPKNLHPAYAIGQIRSMLARGVGWPRRNAGTRRS